MSLGCEHYLTWKRGLLRGMRLQADLSSPGTGGRTGPCGPCPLAVTGDSPGTADGKIKSPGELTWLHLELSGLWQVLSPTPGLSWPICGLNSMIFKSPLRCNVIALDFKDVWKGEWKLLLSLKVLDLSRNSLVVQWLGLPAFTATARAQSLVGDQDPSKPGGVTKVNK